ncbi:MAG: hypothetical protein VR64_10885 [Desulfatitalea sp. BRH_c12]|nr:MAG: hypothetical protein VR64_10885 [Desulfatitalea sp. BRH_c12]
MIKKARHVLKTVFGYEDFVSIQGRVIQHVLDGRDTLAVMPTGAGKSLCFQIPALLFEGLTVVVSPLISLMNDQIQQLRQTGVAAALLNSSLDAVEYRRNVALIKSGQAKLLYVAPETLVKPNLLDLIGALRVDCLAVDEVHCISEWGHDFRPEYRRLAEVRQRLGAAVCLALTATATPNVREDIKACLGLEKGAECVAGFDRPNLLLQVAFKDNAYRQALQVIHKHAGHPGIVYCATRRQVDQLAQALCHDGIAALAYHAGLPDAQRHLHQERFSKDDVQVMVATVAFGMGIDKSNIRFVIHFDLPKNIESYYQEIGRAGRDGAAAECLLLYSYADIHKIKYMIAGMDASRQRTANLLLTVILRYVESDMCRRHVLLDYFGETYAKGNCGMCDNCREIGGKVRNLTVPAQKLLACVKRTGERFGLAHVIDVLRGSKSQKVMRLAHHRLSTYGIGLEYTKSQWQQLARQLLHKGFMVQDLNHGSLQLTSQAWDLFKGCCTFTGVLADGQTDLRVSGAAAAREPGNAAFDGALFERLREKRKALADQAKIPPFVVFSDKTLMEMATWFPQNSEAFLSIHGIGQVKEQQYGAVFMQIIRDYCTANGIAPRLGPSKDALSKPTARTPIPEAKRRQTEIREAYNAGQSIGHLMARFGIKRMTVVSHLYACHRQGHPIRRDGLLAETSVTGAALQQTLQAFEALGADHLAPVYQTMNESIPYEDLHVLRLYYVTTCPPSGDSDRQNAI